MADPGGYLGLTRLGQGVANPAPAPLLRQVRLQVVGRNEELRRRRNAIHRGPEPTMLIGLPGVPRPEPIPGRPLTGGYTDIRGAHGKRR